jgi:hypothetical protein
MLAIGAGRRVTAIFPISKSLLLMPVGMGATVSISRFSDFARETGEAEPFGAADPVHGHCPSEGVELKFIDLQLGCAYMYACSKHGRTLSGRSSMKKMEEIIHE